MGIRCVLCVLLSRQSWSAHSQCFRISQQAYSYDLEKNFSDEIVAFQSLGQSTSIDSSNTGTAK
jgi:ribonuclease I